MQTGKTATQQDNKRDIEERRHNSRRTHSGYV